MEDRMRELVERKNLLESGILPFVEQGSLEEELAFNELFYLQRQIGAIIQSLKGVV